MQHLPIYEQTRQSVPCALLCDGIDTAADRAEQLGTAIELDHLPTTADLVALADTTADEPIVFTCPDELRGVYLALVWGALLCGALGFILWMYAGGAA